MTPWRRLPRRWRPTRRCSGHGYEARALRERPGYAEATVARGTESVEIQWTTDSVFRFFPLVRDEALGLTLHPFDLATNKVLALVGAAGARGLSATTWVPRSHPAAWLSGVGGLREGSGIQPVGHPGAGRALRPLLGRRDRGTGLRRFAA